LYDTIASTIITRAGAENTLYPLLGLPIATFTVSTRLRCD